MANKSNASINANTCIFVRGRITANFCVNTHEENDSNANDYDNEPELIFEWPAYRDGVTPDLRFGDIAELTAEKNTRGPNKFQQASLAANNVLLRSSLYPFVGQYIFRSGGAIPGLTLWEKYDNTSVEMYSSTAYSLSQAPQYLFSNTAFLLSQAPQYLFSSTLYFMVKS